MTRGVMAQCCRAAVEAGMISTNPFKDVPKSAGANAARECYVKADTVRRVMQVAADSDERLQMASSRFAALRVPSKVCKLCCGDVDWDQRSLRVDSPKTATQGRPWRLVPIVPEPLQMLEDALQAAPKSEELILPALRQHRNPAMPVLRAVRAVGVETWLWTFHALRASCEADWAAVHPTADVAASMFHSQVVAVRHDLRSIDANLAAVTGRNGGDTGGDTPAGSVAT